MNTKTKRIAYLKERLAEWRRTQGTDALVETLTQALELEYLTDKTDDSLTNALLKALKAYYRLKSPCTRDERKEHVSYLREEWSHADMARAKALSENDLKTLKDWHRKAQADALLLKKNVIELSLLCILERIPNKEDKLRRLRKQYNRYADGCKESFSVWVRLTAQSDENFFLWLCDVNERLWFHEQRSVLNELLNN